ncbi:hypothetical protein BSKO_06127 [Bryopsis sp. KO-2023]|nr:hypothetical protein BSKO_06127 [Bryopsis sp. KO-2023]
MTQTLGGILLFSEVFCDCFSTKRQAGGRGTAELECPARVKDRRSAVMYLMYRLDENGDRVYTLKKEGPDGKSTISAHPARFSPDDPYSRERITCKKRFGLMPTQGPPFRY